MAGTGRCSVSRVPEGLALRLRELADRLEKSPDRARGKADENLAGLSKESRTSLADTFVASWLSDECAGTAREIRAILDAWSRPVPRPRRGARR